VNKQKTSTEHSPPIKTWRQSSVRKG